MLLRVESDNSNPVPRAKAADESICGLADEPTSARVEPEVSRSSYLKRRLSVPKLAIDCFDNLRKPKVFPGVILSTVVPRCS